MEHRLGRRTPSAPRRTQEACVLQLAQPRIYEPPRSSPDMSRHVQEIEPTTIFEIINLRLWMQKKNHRHSTYRI
jgi:hypothetical protein